MQSFDNSLAISDLKDLTFSLTQNYFNPFNEPPYPYKKEEPI